MSAQLTPEQKEKMMAEFQAFIDVATAEQKEEMLSFLEEMKENAFENLKEEIEEEIPYIDIKPYSHNIINLQLNRMAKDFGDEKTKEFIRNNEDLMAKGWASSAI